MSPESGDKCLSSNNGLNVGSRPVATANMHNPQAHSGIFTTRNPFAVATGCDPTFDCHNILIRFVVTD